ncbi:MAG: hypothetical protein A2504_01210 [Bdellovibrionales bacterium RIFOXYD12_FULL_39_22]|nr:MAG: hypothetical protein A2385_02100 [Bdellovibrionales bacterium RIFOXYB1_FULL_39_21]OFZ42726.1 MAG: hypothetical protein A2485_10285 [Bdellovibrionales bacterium RIFOXYC12_FULL_39_17]OFZ47285.1 MAG: hypothetical protein A2404_14890 [Bdellovibrionales bacterium RIFOXYC1_FULL_39_130]OFZ75451.1 MAG: hypothetical protein A2560_04160 [Bdellovibrionales bacterium RIFOXYD1_FULL_39_84]OFZ93405.1 MAG: hypothetical protein A2504_01210 [Bdellovibrionales bacterium RIFOXYD12_FULL_39_22]HLE12376.1 hy
MKLFNTLLFSLSLSSLALASTSSSTATSSGTSISNLRHLLQKTSFSLSVDNEVRAYALGNKRPESFRNTLATTLGYKLTKSDSLSWYNEVNYKSDPTGAPGKTNFSESFIKYGHSGILKQDKHGVNMGASLTVSATPSEATQKADGLAGYAKVAVGLSRSMGILSMSGGAAFYQFARVAGGSDENYIVLQAAPSISLTNKLSAGAAVVLYNVKDKASPDYYQALRLIPSIDYALSANVSASLFADAFPFSASPGKAFKGDITKYPEMATYGMNISLAAF